MANEKSKFRSYGGVEFLKAKFTKRKWLIENIIRERDTVLFVGEEKAGKSLLIQQMICSLTTEHPFLDKYKVMRPCKITYVQLEGEIEDTQDIFKRLSESVDFAPELFQILYLPAMVLESKEVSNQLYRDIIAHHYPDVLIIDPLYQAMKGSLSDDVPVRAFLANMRDLKNSLNCAIIIVHHTHKIRLNRDGGVIGEGDDAAFGSKFLKAYPDYTMLLAHNKRDGTRILSCATQRGGDIEKHLKLSLVQPYPLYFEEFRIDDMPTHEKSIRELLSVNSNGLSRDEIQTKLKISHDTFYKSLKKLGEEIAKTPRPIKYSLKKGEIVNEQK